MFKVQSLDTRDKFGEKYWSDKVELLYVIQTGQNQVFVSIPYRHASLAVDAYTFVMKEAKLKTFS